MRSEGYLFPPPKKLKEEDEFLALVVEKTGDETRTSMRQSEIYAYSQHIRIRDGYMVMPKYHWNGFSPGEWFFAKVVYAKSRDEKSSYERELRDIRKIKPTEYVKYRIPKTTFEHGYVRVECLFILCPDFIRYRHTNNSYGSYKKLILMDMGQGFVYNHSRDTKLFTSVHPERKYWGVFEFCAKENGACNFGHRSELRDQTNHVLERDSMWQLDHISRTPTKEESVMMDNWLKKLRKDAEDFDKKLEQEGAYSQHDGRHHSTSEKISQNDHDVTLTQSTLSITDQIETLSISGRHTTHQMPSSSEVSIEDSYSQHTLTSQSDISYNPHEFSSFREMEEHRSRVIIEKDVEDQNGKLVRKWFDKETHESSPDPDILHFKFDSRYKVVEPPQQPPVVLPLTNRDRTLSESSVRRSSLGHPLASSTPRPSPETTRRSFNSVEFIRSEESEDEHELDEDETNNLESNQNFMNQTSDTTMMCRDNNANPFRPGHP
ncbi:hypothetical protein GCK72_014194 [Caenorhabditis remanei]|uniref:Uncharacterized protein n=1 Tax=Caenorhabditis remanei TaxID=31234 RepID=A0A6A5GQL7_CAERE|nr:hypothetical protein GCK72_014194 [Caenorhabditis remanei]KAF1757738.1 hypothetical protein GCK72_014194 [Caenorhabditis remanei]